MGLKNASEVTLLNTQLRPLKGRPAARNRSLKYFEGFPQSLDYGLYFFGADGVCQKHVKGQSNAYYVENKKTLIYVHGWEAQIKPTF